MSTASTESGDEPGVVQPILGLVVSLAFVGMGLFLLTETGDSMVFVFISGMGALFAVLATYSLVTSIQDLEAYDPIYIIRADMNAPQKIIKGLVGLALFWVIVLYILGASDPSEAVRIVSELRANQPELLVGWAGFNVLMVLGVMFGSRSRRVHV